MVSFNEKLIMSDLSQNVQCHVKFTQRPIFRGTLQRVIFYPLKHSFEHKIAHCLLLLILKKMQKDFSLVYLVSKLERNSADQMTFWNQFIVYIC